MQHDIFELLDKAGKQGGSDLHIAPGTPPCVRLNGSLVRMTETPLLPAETKEIVKALCGTQARFEQLEADGEIDFAISLTDRRVRVNIFRQRGSYSAALRLITLSVPDFSRLGLPETVKKLAKLQRGIVLVTGTTGSGKSTTLAALIDLINSERKCHILTLEDPVEYLHKHKKAIVNQREIGSDSKSYGAALRAALREDPDVILIGEMRDVDSISIALTAAETGHLVFSTLHTLGAAKTVDRIIDVFPPNQQQQVRIQVSMTLQAVLSQALLPSPDGMSRSAAIELMLVNPAIRNLIRENKTPQIQSAILTSIKEGNMPLDISLISLYKKGRISSEMALMYSMDSDFVKKALFEGGSF